MPDQSNKNHIRYYPAHHFVFYPLLFISIAFGINGYRHHADQHELWGGLIAAFIFIGWLSFMVRQHYALGNQDRIVRLELRLRYFEITGQKFEGLERKFSIGQLTALRFASDEELPILIQRAITEQLSPREIKQSIRNWQPDYMRV